MNHLINDVIFLYQRAVFETKEYFSNHLQNDEYHELLICVSDNPLLYPSQEFLDTQREKIECLKESSSYFSFSEMKNTCFVFTSEIEYVLKNLHPLHMSQTLDFLNAFLDEMCEYLQHKFNLQQKHLA